MSHTVSRPFCESLMQNIVRCAFRGVCEPDYMLTLYILGYNHCITLKITEFESERAFNAWAVYDAKS